MHPLIGFLVSGLAFFPGVLFVIAGAAGLRVERKLARSIGKLSIVMGVLLVAISSTPTPIWLVALQFVTLVTAIIWRTNSKRSWLALASLAVCWLAAIALETPRHLSPRRVSIDRPLLIIGDSLTAGLDDDPFPTWPALVRQTAACLVYDISHVGETARSALKRVSKSQFTPSDVPKAVVIVEIGGNHLLSGRTARQFREDLDALLNDVCSPERDVLMFELPLPPSYVGFGYAQRELAKKHHVTLIPKRVLAAVLAATESTSDSIHLTKSGHERLAAQVLDCLAAKTD